MRLMHGTLNWPRGCRSILPSRSIDSFARLSCGAPRGISSNNSMFPKLAVRTLRQTTLCSKPLRITNLFKDKRAMTTATALVYHEYGQPKDQLRVHTYHVDNPGPNQVLLRTIAFPINPSDINQIEGVYPSRPPLTKDLGTQSPAAVAGNEGLLVVQSAGANVKDLKEGDWVLPKKASFGTWRTHVLADPTELEKISGNGIDPTAAATLIVNPVSAYVMLKSFADLKPGDWIIQNGANSGVGRAVSQFAKHWGINSISIIREREDFDTLSNDLQKAGATYVVSDKQLSEKTFKDQVEKWTQGAGIKLALNCVGGDAATSLARTLAHGGHFVTYGSMSRKPVSFPATIFIFKDIVAQGFWLTAHFAKDPDSKLKIAEEILDMIRTGKFIPAPTSPHVLSLGDAPVKLLDTFMEALQDNSGQKAVVLFKP